MHSTVKVAPWTAAKINPILDASRKAAAKTCIRDGGGIMRCGLQWTTGSYDGSTGIGENMAALEVMLSALDGPGPVTGTSGGTSKSNPNAGVGTGGSGPDGGPIMFAPVTTADKAGAAILTVVVVVFMLAGAAWMIISETSSSDLGWFMGRG